MPEIRNTKFMAQDKQPWYLSSTKSGKLSLTLFGLSITGISPFVVTVFKLFGVELTTEETTALIMSVVTSIGAVITAYGAIRKLLNKTVLNK